MKRYLFKSGIIFGILITVLSMGRICQAEEFKTKQDTLRWFKGARFGIFIHWDPRVQVGKIDHPVPRYETKKLHIDAIKNKWRDFNPDKFNAEEWINLFVESGAQYFTFTTKHQFGFSMFDNPYSDFDMMSTKFKHDICKELSDAAKDKIVVCWYHSSEGGSENEKRYKLKGFNPYKDFSSIDQTFEEWRYKSVEHLLSNYGPIAALWWDGSGTGKMELIDMVRSKQPHIIMNGRINIKGFKGDFYTPEQRVGTFNMDMPWECCMPLESDIWFWCGGFDVKNAEVCTKLLIQCASGDGNLLLSTSPMPDGRIQPEQAETLRGIGRYLKKYGETIYNTRGGPYKPGLWGGATRRGSKIYLHITEILQDGKLVLPPFPKKIVSYKLLTPGTVVVKQTDKELEIDLDKTALNADVIDRIVEITIDGDSMEIKPIETMSHEKSLTVDATVTASSMESPKHGPDSVVEHSDLDVDAIVKLKRKLKGNFKVPDYAKKYKFVLAHRNYHSRYWSAKEGDKQPWIMVDMGKPVTFSRISLMEKNNRIRAFKIEYLDGDQWKSIYSGKGLDIFSIKTGPITAQKVRLTVLKSEDGPPELHIFDLFSKP